MQFSARKILDPTISITTVANGTTQFQYPSITFCPHIDNFQQIVDILLYNNITYIDDLDSVMTLLNRFARWRIISDYILHMLGRNLQIFIM